MKKYIWLMVLISTTTFAGPGDGAGNGGGLWTCYTNGSTNHEDIKRMELVDFFEAKVESQYEINQYPGLSYQEILEIYKDRIAEIDINLYLELQPYFEALDNKLNFIDVDLEIVDDALYRISPNQKWCGDADIVYQQLANFTDYGKILVNNALFNHSKMTNLNRAGLLLHEVIYEHLRKKYKNINSVGTRKLVAIIASNLPIQTARSGFDIYLGVDRHCGLSGTIEERIQKCSTLTRSKYGDFVLVTRKFLQMGGNWGDAQLTATIYKDTKTGIYWWAKNSAHLIESGIYTIAGFHELCGRSVSNLGMKASWRLPSIGTYQTARKNGLSIITNRAELLSTSVDPKNKGKFYFLQSSTGNVISKYIPSVDIEPFICYAPSLDVLDL